MQRSRYAPCHAMILELREACGARPYLPGMHRCHGHARPAPAAHLVSVRLVQRVGLLHAARGVRVALTEAWPRPAGQRLRQRQQQEAAVRRPAARPPTQARDRAEDIGT